MTHNPPSANRARHEEILEFLQVVPDDFQAALESLNHSDTPYARRTVVRAAFAAIEGLTFAIKQECLHRPDDASKHYGASELAMLREETYGVGSKGQVLTQAKFIPLLDNVRFAMAMYRRGSLEGHGLDLSGLGWQHFRDATVVRNRITHPKRISDLDVLNEDLKAVLGAYEWFMESLVAVLLEVRDDLRSKNSQVQAEIAQIRGEGARAREGTGQVLDRLRSESREPSIDHDRDA